MSKEDNYSNLDYASAASKRYYEKNREKILAWHKAYRSAHKEEFHEIAKKRWENMTEEQKEKERARQREYHRKKALNVCK